MAASSNAASRSSPRFPASSTIPMSRRSSASPASAPTHGATAQARPASSTPTESPPRRRNEPPQSSFSPGTADTGRSRSTTTSGTSSSTKTPVSRAQASRPRTTRCAPTSPSRSSSTRPTSTASPRQPGTSRYSARTPSPRSSLPERRDGRSGRRTNGPASLRQRGHGSAHVDSGEGNVRPESEAVSTPVELSGGQPQQRNNRSSPSSAWISRNSGAWDSPELAATSAHGNWRDFDRDHGRISVGAASDSIFSPNFRRVWPHRLTGSTAAVMAKETSRTRSAER